MAITSIITTIMMIVIIITTIRIDNVYIYIYMYTCMYMFVFSPGGEVGANVYTLSFFPVRTQIRMITPSRIQCRTRLS